MGKRFGFERAYFLSTCVGDANGGSLGNQVDVRLRPHQEAVPEAGPEPLRLVRALLEPRHQARAEGRVQGRGRELDQVPSPQQRNIANTLHCT